MSDAPPIAAPKKKKKRRARFVPKRSAFSSAAMRSEINVTPLVDVVLVLLIIFMVVTPMLSRGIKVELPETTHHEKKEDSGEQIVVSVGKDGRAFVGTDEANDANLPALLRKALSGKSHEVHVKADRSLDYGRVRALLEKIHDAGASKVALGTDEKRGAAVSFGASGKRGAVTSAINITPLVDVVLVLLIIFMVLTPILLKQLDVNVPQKDTQVEVAPPVTTEQVVIRIDSDGKLSINHEPVAPDALSDRIQTIYANRREKVLFFDVDDAANYGFVVSVMDTCRGAGVKVLGIMTKG